MSNKSDQVLTDRRGDVQWITINRPDQRNAINEEVLIQIRSAILEANDDPTARAIVLTGTGDRAFCAGAALKCDRGAHRSGLHRGSQVQ